MTTQQPSEIQWKPGDRAITNAPTYGRSGSSSFCTLLRPARTRGCWRVQIDGNQRPDTIHANYLRPVEESTT